MPQAVWHARVVRENAECGGARGRVRRAKFAREQGSNSFDFTGVRNVERLVVFSSPLEQVGSVLANLGCGLLAAAKDCHASVGDELEAEIKTDGWAIFLSGNLLDFFALGSSTVFSITRGTKNSTSSGSSGFTYSSRPSGLRQLANATLRDVGRRPVPSTTNLRYRIAIRLCGARSR